MSKNQKTEGDCWACCLELCLEISWSHKKPVFKYNTFILVLNTPYSNYPPFLNYPPHPSLTANHDKLELWQVFHVAFKIERLCSLRSFFALSTTSA